MKTSNKLYNMYCEVIKEAKNSVKELLDKQPNKTLMFKNNNPWIIIEHWEGCDKVEVKGITTRNGFIELICEGFYAKPEDIISSEWLYILECVESELVDNVDDWWYNTDFRVMECITGYRHRDFSADNSYQEFVDACNEWWGKKTYNEKLTIFTNNKI